ncbi:MAG: protein translocase subunit SecD, partial [Patescibacteria group bacterium]
GVSEPKVYEESVGGSERLVVELAGIRDVTQAIREIGETPLLDFREVKEGEATTTPEFLRTELTGRYVKGAQVGFDSVTNQPQVNIQFNDEGAKLFEEITGRNVGKPLAIFLDNEPLELPIVQGKISGGDAQITGSFTIKEVRTLVERFNAGALPAPIALINQQTIGPDFGADALRRAIAAGALGTLIVMVFMLAYYRFFGIFASLALLMYVAITLGFFKVLGVTMTLAGIAGFILSIGMAVDANILVFERTKEELRKGLSRTAAVQEGFKRAWTSIRDSNISTMITALVLYYFTSSFVRGFALTLFIGVVVSMFSAITVTRTWLKIFIKDKQ